MIARRWNLSVSLASVLLLLGAGSFAQELRISHILLSSKSDAEKVRAEIVEKGASREAFKGACYQHSKDPTTKQLGGDLGWNKRTSQLDPLFVQAAWKLSVGEISPPVLTSFGWHLIQVTESREAEAPAPVTPPKTATPKPPVNPDPAVDPHAGHNHPPGEHPTDETSEPQKPVLETKRRPLRAPVSLFLSIESVFSSGRSSPQQVTFSPSDAVELNLSLKNEGTESQQVPVASLLPLGFDVTRLSDGKALSPNLEAVAEPASFFTTLATYDITGRVIDLSSLYPSFTASGRYAVDWSATTLFRNLESRFPAVRDVEGYGLIKSRLSTSTAIRVDRVLREKARHRDVQLRTKPFNLAIFDRIESGKNYYAKIALRGGKEIVLELSASAPGGNLTALRQFIGLANEGFYDGLTFYDVEAGDYALGGCPTNNGLGAPSITSSGVENTGKVKHTTGTVSLVTRAQPTAGPIGGGEIGSIFFVSLKDHPEWDEVHVPFGKVVAGIEALGGLKDGEGLIESVVILTEGDYSGADAAAAVAKGNPEAVIHTAKGKLRVTLYEDVAFNTVASFITLAESGFYSKGPNDGKMTFYELFTDPAKGKLVAITGSPQNDSIGGPGYSLRDEVNERKCERGALVMVKQFDPESGGYVANSAGSQFFICFLDLPSYDFEGAFTVFGKIHAEDLPTLDKIEKGDTIEKIEISKKGPRDYSKFRKAS